MIDVTCAIIRKANKILICQQSSNGKLPLKWEFPGGKVKKGEGKKECIKREIKEELQLEIEVLQALKKTEHHYSDFSIRLFPFICEVISGQPTLVVHEQIKWVEIPNLNQYDWAEANLAIVNELINIYKTSGISKKNE